MKFLLLTSACLLATAASLQAQEINFADYYRNEHGALTVTAFKVRDLRFQVLMNDDVKEVEIGDGYDAVIELEGWRFMDIVVDIQAPAYLYLDGDPGCTPVDDCRAALNLQFSYTNGGELLDETTTARPFVGSTARFPIRRRGAGPPAPPPTPTPGLPPVVPTDIAFVYLYGTLTAGPGMVAGSYSNTITINIEYF